ncbi:hypothetical protein [Paenibacillus sp. MMO-58]|uniref:hypothetical protein n=1 Tax=Paenibacillus sp. MMO-58 TaxID=3081290 RepID=UPI00301A1C7E
MARITITNDNGEIEEIESNAFVIVFDSGSDIGVTGELTPEFIQECLIIGPIEQFAQQYEKGEIG